MTESNAAPWGRTASFARECVAKIAHGEELAAADAAAFSAYLDGREAAGHRLLGRFAGPDPSFDTVSGRCGIGPGSRSIQAV